MSLQRPTASAVRAVFAAAVCALGLCPGQAWAIDELRRFAVIAGNDEGGADTRPLLYAREDARKLHGILTRLGGVQPEDARLLLNASADEFLRALSELEARALQARREGQRTALLVYYSGHAKDGALRLGSTQVPFAALRGRLGQAPADVRVGIFDALPPP